MSINIYIYIYMYWLQEEFYRSKVERVLELLKCSRRMRDLSIRVGCKG